VSPEAKELNAGAAIAATEEKRNIGRMRKAITFFRFFIIPLLNTKIPP